MAKKPGIKLIANNKKAFHDYFIEDTYEAGIALAGTEVKSLRSEINKMEAKLKEKGLTLVPIKVYFKNSLVKVEIGMARGKKLYDKRQDIAKKDQRREAERDFKVKNLY